MIQEKSNRILRGIGLWLAFLSFILVAWSCLQMRIAAEEGIFIAQSIVAAGYILCPVVVVFGVIFTVSYKIEDPKRQFLCLVIAIAILVILIAGLYIAWHMDYSRAVDVKIAILQGQYP